MEATILLLARLPHAIEYYLDQLVFPATMHNQPLKLSASGHDLGGSMLFRSRLGFSGTPSDLLPLELGKCHYERGSDGKMLTLLTSPEVVSIRVSEPACCAPHPLSVRLRWAWPGGEQQSVATAFTPREDGLPRPADTSRTNLADALALLSRWRVSNP